MDYRYGLAVALTCAWSLTPGTAQAGSITVVGSVRALTNISQMGTGYETADFSEGSHLTFLPLNTYSARGLTFHTGDLTSALAGVTTPGAASIGPYIYTSGSWFPTPIAGGGTYAPPYAYHAGIATFAAGTRRVGLTASQNGTTYLVVWDTSGTMIGQVTWAPSGDAGFVGVEASVDIGMVTFGNRDLWAGETYTIGGGTIISDTWVWAPGAVCGDGVPDGFEVCDDGNADNTDACLDSCAVASCGDSYVRAGVEDCDDGNADNTDACTDVCAAASCGDGYVEAGVEPCDDGNADNTDACLDTCAAASCGDGYVEAGVEDCDDGNADNTDACLDSCAAASCGDGYVQAGVEGCDDGASNSDTAVDACRPTCMPAGCGDGVMDTGEACDDGTLNSDSTADACRMSCMVATCGDGVVDTGEECDGSPACNGGCALMTDAGSPDAGMPDSGAPDSGTPDSGAPDSGVPAVDSGTPPPDDGGCSAAAPGTSSNTHGAALLLAALGLAYTRRRR